MNDPNPSVPPRKGRGCLFYGCLVTLLVLFLIGLLAFFTVRWIRNQFIALTDGAPMELPRVEMAEAEFNELDGRVKSFGAALEGGKPAEPLVLTEREVNALMFRKPDLKPLADKVYVSLGSNQVTGQISLPLNGLAWLAKGRYLNGQATFNVSLVNGALFITADQMQVKGHPLPETFMQEVRKENLASDVSRDPRNAEVIRKLGSIRVEDGRAIIEARKAP